jgi:tetratricopeptide (TPR) repeat protein
VKDIARTLPLSVRAVIERKLAHLDEPARQLLSAACVQGHAFDSTVLAAVVDQPTDTVEVRLAELERAHALIQRVAERELPDGSLSLRCRFVHALYHDALLSDLLPSRRASISRAVAIEMIRRYADAAEELSAQLGDLLETGRDFEMAASYFLTAARVAIAAGSYPEGAALARRGLTNLERNAASAQRDAREMALQTMLGVASMSMEGFGSRNVGRIYERALALSRNLGPTPELFPVLGGLWLFHVIRSQLVTARELAETILTAAERSGQPAKLAEAHQAVGITLMDMGELRGALTHFRRSIELQEQEQQPYGALQYTLAPAVGARIGAARVLVPLGLPDTALAEANEALALARRLGHASSLGIGLNFAAIVHCLRGEPDAAEALAAEAIAVSSEHGLPQTLAWGLFWQGWARAERGDREAIEQMRAAVEGLRAAGSWISVPIFLGLLAEAVRRSGDPTQALELLDEGLLQGATSCDLYGEAELHLFRGHALLDLRRSEEARAAIRDSLDVARRQAAPWWELRAAVAWTAAFPTGDGCAREALGAALEKLATFDEGGSLSLLAEARARYAAG